MTLPKSYAGFFAGGLAIVLGGAVLALLTTLAFAGGLLCLGGLGSASGWLWYRRVQDRELTVDGRTLARLVGLVRAARRQWGRSYRRAPVYLVVGDAHVGKSAVLHALGGAHGMVLEAAPAPETQSRLLAEGGNLFLEVPSHLIQADAANMWQAYLTCLRRMGLGARVRGVLVVLDANTLQQPTTDSPWSQVLHCMVQTLGVRAPTYLIVNRCDAIPGFVETFNRLPDTVRDAPWGFAVDDADETVLATGHRFDALMDTLRAFAMANLSAQDNPSTRAPLYLFPQYVSMLRRGLCARVERIFGTQARAQRPRFGGLYLMAAPGADPRLAPAMHKVLTTPEATGWTPLALTAGGAPQAAVTTPALACSVFSRSNDTPWGAAYFVRHFAHHVLAHDQTLRLGVAHPGLRGQLAQARVQVAAGMLVAGFWLMAVAGFLGASQHVRRALDVVATPYALWEQPSDLLLEHLAQEVIRLREHPSSGVWSMMGLGESAMAAPLATLYLRIIDQEMVDPVLHEDITAMQASWQRHAFGGTAPPRAESIRLSAQLRAHLLLTQPKAAHEPQLRGRHAELLVRDLAARFAAPQESDAAAGRGAQDVRAHLALYVAVLADHPDLAPIRDHEGISRTRALLAKVPLSDRLIDQVAHDVGLREPSVRLDDLVPSADVPLLGKMEVPALFTRQGYLAYGKAWLQQEETDSDGWIYWAQTPTPAQRQAQAFRVRSRYFARYIESWRAFVDHLAWQKPQDVQDGHSMLLALTRSEPPPLRALWQALADNTQLHAPDAMAPAPLGQGVLGGLRRRLQTLPLAQGDDAPARPIQGASDVDTAFASLVAFGGPAGNVEAQAQAPLATYQALLAELRVGVEAYLESPREGDAMLQQLRRARTKAVGLVGAAQQTPATHAALNRLLIVPLDHMTRALTRGARSEVGALWCPGVVQPYNQLAQSYPLNPSGADASLEDFAAYFHPGTGQPWAFYRSHLSQDVVQRINTFAFDEKLGGALKHTFDPRVLGFYNHLYASSHALFTANGGAALGTDFQMRVLMDKELWETTLTVHDKVLHVAPGQQQTPWHTLHWPPLEAERGNTTLAMVGVGGVREQVDFEGVWGLWRLLESGHVTIDKASGIMTVLYRPGGLLGHARVEIRPKRRDHVFFLAGAQGARGGLFAYLRDGQLRPPRALGTGQVACAYATP